MHGGRMRRLSPVIVKRPLPVRHPTADATGCGILLVEQHVRLALEVADRAYVLSHGSLILEADADQLAADRHLVESSYLGEQSLGTLAAAGAPSVGPRPRR